MKSEKLFAKVLCLAVSLIMLFSFMTGCGGNEANKETTTGMATTTAQQTQGQIETTAAEPVKFKGEIIVATGQPPGYAEAWQVLAEAYRKYQPDVTVTVEPKPMDGYGDWLAAQMKSGDIRPDIVNSSSKRDAGEFIDWKDYLYTTNPYEGGVVWEEILPEESQNSTYKGKLIALASERTKFTLLYNKDIFDKVGVTVPKTWDELVSVCEKLHTAGYIPISLAGDNPSFQYGQFSYFELIYQDQYQRDKVPLFAAQPGDYNYDDSKDPGFKFDIGNPFGDFPGAYTSEGRRAMKAIKDGTWRFDGPDVKEMYENLKKVFPKYAPPGWAGVDGTASVGYFMREEAAMLPDGSWRVVTFKKDQEDLAKYDTLDDKRKAELKGWKKFNLGAMNYPTMTGQYVKSPARDYELSGVDVGAVKKNKEHDDMVADFMKFYLSTEGFSIFYNAIGATGNYQAGVPIISGIKYDEAYMALDGMESLGNAVSDPTWYTKQCYGWVPEAVRDYTDYTLQYFNDKINMDEFLKKHQENFMKYFDKAMEGSNWVAEDLEHPELPPKNATNSN